MRAKFFELFRKRHIIFQRIFWPAVVKNISGVADSRFADAACLEHRIQRHAHVLNRIQRIEYPKNVHTFRVRLAHKFADHIVRIRRVPHGVRSTQQHLKTNVRNRSAQLPQSLPRIFVQKSQRRIERRTAPHLQAEQVRQPLRHRRSSRQQIVSPHASCHQRLVRIAVSRVRDQQPLFFLRPLRELCRPEFLQQLPRAGFRLRSRGSKGCHRNFRSFDARRNLLPFHLRVPVENHVSQICE